MYAIMFECMSIYMFTPMFEKGHGLNLVIEKQ